MKTSQAIRTYNALTPALATGPTEAKEERERNKKKFLEAFQKILADSGYPVDSSIRFSAGESSSCKVSVRLHSLIYHFNFLIVPYVS
jgi:hypothetical protein